QRIDILLTTLLVIAIVIGLQTVGVVLMSAIIIAPAAAARQWTNRLSLVVLIAGLFGALSGVSGAILSATTTQLPTGPTIVLCATAIVLLSLLFAPNRGLLAAWTRARRNRKILRVAGVLEDLYTLALQHPDYQHGHTAGVLRTMTATPESVEPSIHALVERGLVKPVGDEAWALTEAGLREALRLSANQKLDTQS
ncbi:MAG: metal ABC transporter permease, partial [Rubricoccaceae bacterium]|nr:metal ABC transporter permease [Rubricoccaceae bacterium]